MSRIFPTILTEKFKKSATYPGRFLFASPFPAAGAQKYECRRVFSPIRRGFFPLTRAEAFLSSLPIMAKIDLELVKAVLQRADLDAKKIAQIIEDITFESKAQESEKEKEPPVKKQFVVIVSDPYGKFADADYTGWVVQIPEDENPSTALERIHLGSYDYNITPKGRRMPLKTVAEACEFGSAKIFKEHKVWVKTKEPVLIVRTSNKIPREEKSE